MKYIDTHSHFNLSQFDADREDAIVRMQEVGVGTICVGVNEETSAKAIEIASTHETIWAIVGQHPTEWFQEFDVDVFISLARQAKVVAIGECGLDYYREQDRTHVSEQKKLFESQIALAKELDLPLMLHIRPREGTMDAYEDALTLLKTWNLQWPQMRGTAHFFAGTKDVARQFLDLGFHISFSGIITIFPEYEEVVKYVPLDRILSETDAPFAAPIPYRGTRNEPSYVVEIVKKIALLKGGSLEDTQAQLLKNASSLFGLS